MQSKRETPPGVGHIPLLRVHVGSDRGACLVAATNVVLARGPVQGRPSNVSRVVAEGVCETCGPHFHGCPRQLFLGQRLFQRNTCLTVILS